jgi:hypothetical protein
MQVTLQWVQWGIENYNTSLFDGFMGGFIEVADNLLFIGEYIQDLARLIVHHPNQFLALGFLAFLLDTAELDD